MFAEASVTHEYVTLVSLGIITSTFITFLLICCMGGLFRVSEHL